MAEKKEKVLNPTCGIIMPISLIENCPPEHWADVLGILKDVCIVNDFTPNLVSDADDIGVIHNRIIENIYSSDIVICDVSCKNANVMFELGMRLAFDKPTIIIKDDLTGYSFDTSLIEHLEYPRDLRFTSINRFKDNLGKKLKATFEKAQSDPSYSTFLKNFGKYKIAHLEDREISSDTFILNAIEDLKRDVRTIRNIAVNERESNYSIHQGNVIGSKKPNTAKLLIQNAVEKYLKTKKFSGSEEELELIIEDVVNELGHDYSVTSKVSSRKELEQIIRECIYLM